MKSEYLNYPVGTVLKETCKNKVFYYIVGEYFIYANDYNDPQIRPHKFYFYEDITVANEDEKKRFIKDLKKNHLIWHEETGKLEREFEEVSLNVKVKVKPGTDIDKLLEKLNLDIERIPYYIYNMKFEKQ